MAARSRNSRDPRRGAALVMAGGVAANCAANSRLVGEGPFDEIWVPPTPGDAGTAIGAAVHVASLRRHLRQSVSGHVLESSYLEEPHYQPAAKRLGEWLASSGNIISTANRFTLQPFATVIFPMAASPLR